MKNLLFALKKVVLFTLIISTNYSLLFAQSEKFGKIDVSAFTPTEFEKDTSIAAIVLFETGKTQFQYAESRGFQTVLDVHVRIKILRKSGYDKADQSITCYAPSNSRREQVSNLKGYTHLLENGKVVSYKLDKKSIFDEKVSDNVTRTKFTMPQIVEGAIMEYSYTIYSDFIENLPGWNFQSDVPVLWSEYEVHIPEYFEYKIITNGYHPFHAKESKTNTGTITRLTQQLNITKATWIAKNVPAFKNEQFITTPSDYLMKVGFQMSRYVFPNSPVKDVSASWEQLVTRLREAEYFGLQLNKKGLVKDIAEAIKIQHKTPKERLIAAHQYMQKNFQWNEKYGIGNDLGVRKALNEHTGNGADLNFLMVLLLNELEITSYPVLISTRRHGQINQLYPSLDRFNHVITYARVDEQDILIDAVAKSCALGVLPFQCLNGNGLVVKETNSEWVSLYPTAKSSEFSSALLTLDDEGIIKGKVQYQCKAYAAMSERNSVASSGEKEYIKKSWEDEIDNAEITSYSFNNLDNTDLPFSAEIELSLSPDGGGERIYWSPFLRVPYEENPFKQEQRSFPVDFGVPFEETFIVNLMLSSKYSIEELPKSQSIRIPDNGGEFSYYITTSEQMLQFKGVLKINKAIYSPEEYAFLKELFTLMISKFGEQVVFKKNNN